MFQNNTILQQNNNFWNIQAIGYNVLDNKTYTKTLLIVKEDQTHYLIILIKI